VFALDFLEEEGDVTSATGELNPVSFVPALQKSEVSWLNEKMREMVGKGTYFTALPGSGIHAFVVCGYRV